jgi:N-methylhydantoinase A
VFLGHLSREALLGGTMPIDATASQQAISANLAQPLDMTTGQAAAGILEVLAAQVATSMRSVTIEKGYDPRDFTLVAYGGAGPTVACAIALELEIPDVCIPSDPGNFCAVGMLSTDLVRNYSLTQISLLDQTTPDALRAVLESLEQTGVRELEAQGLGEGSMTTEYLLDMRYLGQSYEVTVAAQDLRKEHLTKAFHQAHGRLLGHTAEAEPIEVVSYRVRCTARLSEFTASAPPLESDNLKEPHDHRSMFFPGETRTVSVPIYERTQLQSGFAIRGPAVIEEYSSTTVVYPGFRVFVDSYGNLILTSHA